jgi:cytoskeleton protein RodZ
LNSVVEKKADLSEGAAERGGMPGEPGESLGKSLARARDSRKLSREEASGQTRIPVQYLRMMESGDYRLISDQLYLLPYVRKYAAFLGLDAEDSAMRFIREVQRADNSVARLAEPLAMEQKRRGTWVGLAAVVVLVAAAGWLYLLKSHWHREHSAAPTAIPSAGAKPSPAGAHLFSVAPAPATNEQPVQATATGSPHPHDEADTAATH